MIPIEVTHDVSERDKIMISEIQAYLDANVDAAILESDNKVTAQRNCELYNRILRKMKIAEKYKMCQRKGKVIIHKKNVRILVER